MSEICVARGQPTLTEPVKPFEFHHGQKTAKVQDSQTVCGICGSVNYADAQASRHEFAIAARIVEMDGLPRPEELRDIRRQYAFQQTDLGAMLSVSPNSSTRWERGRLPQRKAADTLIRMLATNPEVARNLMEQTRVENPASATILATHAALGTGQGGLRGPERRATHLEDCADHQTDITRLICVST
jgi:putative zinc finger/helix-turn-helix YgiT family protein